MSRQSAKLYQVYPYINVYIYIYHIIAVFWMWTCAEYNVYYLHQMSRGFEMEHLISAPFAAWSSTTAASPKAIPQNWGDANYNKFTSNKPISMASMLLNNLRAWHVAALSQTLVPRAHSRNLALPLQYPLGIFKMSKSIQSVYKVDTVQACASTLWEPASKLSTVHPSK